MIRRYQVFDVFTDRPLSGNPLAVVLDTEGLDTAAMQRIAREFNLSETVFVLPAENPTHSAKARIFTPAQELPFAGHPTVGTAICLALKRVGAGAKEAVVVLEEKVGVVRCGVRLDGSGGFAEFDCPRLPEREGTAPARDEIAVLLNLTPADVGFENHQPSRWTAGVPYYFVPVHDMAALANARANAAGWSAAFGTDGVFIYTRETEGHDHGFRARMFAPEHGIVEDPATGSAVAAFAGPWNEFDAPRDGVHAVVVEQGFEMGRPSLIRLEMTVGTGAVTLVRIGGDAVRVMSGTLAI